MKARLRHRDLRRSLSTAQVEQTQVSVCSKRRAFHVERRKGNEELGSQVKEDSHFRALPGVPTVRACEVGTTCHLSPAWPGPGERHAALQELTIKTEPFQGQGQVLVMGATEAQCHYCQCPRGARAPRVTSLGGAGWSSVWSHQAQMGQACCPSNVRCTRLRRAQSWVGTESRPVCPDPVPAGCPQERVRGQRPGSRKTKLPRPRMGCSPPAVGEGPSWGLCSPVGKRDVGPLPSRCGGQVKHSHWPK